MAKKKILEVDEVRLNVLESSPPQLGITSIGTVPTDGWKDPELVPYVYIQPPPDGIYDFDFVAEPPEGVAPQVITPIIVRLTLDPLPDNLKGVRIHASRNATIALLDSGPGGGQTICIRGTLTDEGVECQALRTRNDELYTLVGDLSGFQVGDEVFVAGITAEISFCQQGITIAVQWISKVPPKV